jgi:hypothetical protein
MVHLGYTLDTAAMVFSVPPKKLTGIKILALSLIRYAKSHRRWVSKLKLASVVGKVMALRLAIPQARTRCHSLYLAMSATVSWHVDIQLSNQAVKDLVWMSQLTEVDCFKDMLPPQPDLTIWTDASDQAWGWTMPSVVEGQGFFMEEDLIQHITWKELHAVTEALRVLGQSHNSKTIRLMTDNQVVMHVVNKGASRSRQLMTEFRLMSELCLQHGFRLQANYLPSLQNSRADFLSRMIPASEWSLSEDLLARLQYKYQTFEVDRFATQETSVCKRYNSLVLTPGSLGNAFNLNWAGTFNLVNPPFALISRVLTKMKLESAGGIVIVPYWPSQPWWPILTELSMEITVLSRLETIQAVIPRSSVIPEPLRHNWKLAICYVPGSFSQRLI